MDEQPNYHKTIEVDGEIIATIHALSKNDYAAIESYSSKKKLVDGADGNKEFISDFSLVRVRVMRMYRSLTGTKESGWKWDREITLDSVSKIYPDSLFDLIDDEILKFEKENEVTEGIAKN